GRLRELEVARLVPRIGLQILTRPELRRVHEQAHDDDLASLPGGPEQRQVAVVEVAHRGYEADCPSLAARGGEGLAERRSGTSHSHSEASCRAARARARSASAS